MRKGIFLPEGIRLNDRMGRDQQKKENCDAACAGNCITVMLQLYYSYISDMQRILHCGSFWIYAVSC